MDRAILRLDEICLNAVGSKIAPSPSLALGAGEPPKTTEDFVVYIFVVQESRNTMDCITCGNFTTSLMASWSPWAGEVKLGSTSVTSPSYWDETEHNVTCIMKAHNSYKCHTCTLQSNVLCIIFTNITLQFTSSFPRWSHSLTTLY